MAVTGSFHKQPNEQYPIAIDYAGRLPAGSSLVSGTITALDLATGLDASADILISTTATVSGTQLLGRVKSGMDGVTYKLTFQATLDSGTPADILEDAVLMFCRES